MVFVLMCSCMCICMCYFVCIKVICQCLVSSSVVHHIFELGSFTKPGSTNRLESGWGAQEICFPQGLQMCIAIEGFPKSLLIKYGFKTISDMYAMHTDHYHQFLMRCWDFEVRFYAYKFCALCTKSSL